MYNLCCIFTLVYLVIPYVVCCMYVCIYPVGCLYIVAEDKGFCTMTLCGALQGLNSAISWGGVGSPPDFHRNQAVLPLSKMYSFQ